METYHVDRSRVPSVKKTSDGYLRGDAIVTRIGVFTYLNADGTYRKELRHPDDVLSVESLGTLQMIPVTVGHPPEPVTSENADRLSVGFTGQEVRVDGRHIVVPLTVTTRAGIEAIQGGSQELSLGYKLDLIEESGSYDGESYTHRQTNIRYNHLAIVDKARAGRAARLNLDGIEASVLIHSMEKETTMHKVNVDGIAYDAAPEVVNYLSKQTARADKAEAELQTERARADRAEAARDDATERANKAENSLKNSVPSSEIQALVQSRVALESRVARVVNVDGMSSMSDIALMTAALKSKNPSINLDGKSEDYITARFDALIEGLGTSDVKLGRVAPTAASTPQNRGDAASEEEAYKRSITNFNDWRNAK